MNTGNLSDKYNLENDSRLTLPDDTITIFKHDMIKGHLKGEKIAGGNYIKLAKIPINVRIYWNSKFDRSSAKLLDESNRGMRILKQNDDKRLMTFRNFYLWTEGDLSDIDSWTNRQRELQVEVSGIGAELTPLIANASSEIRVESVDKLHSIRQLENFGKGDTALDAGEVMKRLADCTCKNAQNSTSSLAIQTQILDKIGDNSGNKEFQDTLLQLIRDQQALQNEYQEQMKQLVTEATEILKQIQENGTGGSDMPTDMTQTNLLLTQGNQLSTEIKALQEKIEANSKSINDLVSTMNSTLNEVNVSMSATALNTAGIKGLASAMSGTSANIVDNGLKLTTISDTLLDIKNKQIADSSVLTAQNSNLNLIKTNTSETTGAINALKTDNSGKLTTINASIAANSAKLDTINQESTQQALLEQLQSVNISLQTLNNTLLQGGIGYQKMLPQDFKIQFYNFVNSSDVPYALSYNDHYTHKHIRINTNNNTAGYNDGRFVPIKKFIRQSKQNVLEEIDITSFAEQAPKVNVGVNTLLSPYNAVYLNFKSNYQFHYEIQPVISLRAIGSDGRYTSFSMQNAKKVLQQMSGDPVTTKVIMGIAQGTNMSFEGQGSLQYECNITTDKSNIHRAIVCCSENIKQESTDNDRYMFNSFFIVNKGNTAISSNENETYNICIDEIYLNFYIVEVGKKIENSSLDLETRI